MTAFILAEFCNEHSVDMNLRINLIFVLFACITLKPVNILADIDSANVKARTSYSLGHVIGQSFKRKNIKLNDWVLNKGLEDARQKIPPLISPKEIDKLTADINKNLRVKMDLETPVIINSRRQKYQNRRSSGKAFIQANVNRKGVVSLPSGVQYKVLRKGNGVSPTPQDLVTIRYQSKTLDGRGVGQTSNTGEPITYPVSALIKGLVEALQLMHEGGKWEIYIPPELAYGKKGMYAYQTIIMNVDLISVN